MFSSQAIYSEITFQPNKPNNVLKTTDHSPYDEEYLSPSIGTKIGCGLAGSFLFGAGNIIALGVPFFGRAAILTMDSNMPLKDNGVFMICSAGCISSAVVSALSFYGSYKLFEFCWN